jgi:hypothetical protein
MSTLAAATSDSTGFATMAKFFVIALIVVTPFGIRVFRRISAQRAAEAAADGANANGGPDSAGSGVDPADRPDDFTRLDAIIRSMELVASRLHEGDAASLIVAKAPVSQTRRLDPRVARTIMSDTARRVGLDCSFDSEVADPDMQRLLLTRIAPPS